MPRTPPAFGLVVLGAVLILSGCARSSTFLHFDAPPAIEIGVPSSTSNELTSSTPEILLTDEFDRRRAIAYAVDVAPGQVVVVRMEADAFTPWISILNSRGGAYQRGGADGNASVVELNEPGQFYVLAGTWSEAGVGPFTLRTTLDEAAEAAESPTPPPAEPSPAPDAEPPPPPAPEASGGTLPHSTRIEGRLTPESPTHFAGTDDFVRGPAYTVELGDDEAVIILLSARGFYPVIHAQDASGGEPRRTEAAQRTAGNEPGGHLRRKLLGPGRYDVYVGGHRESERNGTYTLRTRPAENAAFITRFALDDRGFYGTINALNAEPVVTTEDGVEFDSHTYEIEVLAGQHLTAELTSTDFDPILALKRGDEVIAINDDWEGALDTSKLQLQIRESGTYTLVVASYDALGRDLWEYSLEASTTE